MRLCSDQDYSLERYKHAVHLFLSKHPNGEVRSHPYRPGGHSYPKKRKRTKVVEECSPANVINELVESSSDEEEEISLSDISLDEWSDSESD